MYGHKQLKSSTTLAACMQDITSDGIGHDIIVSSCPRLRLPTEVAAHEALYAHEEACMYDMQQDTLSLVEATCLFGTRERAVKTTDSISHRSKYHYMTELNYTCRDNVRLVKAIAHGHQNRCGNTGSAVAVYAFR